MKKLLFRIAGILTALSAPLMISSVAHAANHTWTGAGTPDGSGNLLFSDAANWDVAPTTDGTATLIFPHNVSSNKIYNDLTAGTGFAGITIAVDGTAVDGTANCPSTDIRITGNAINLGGNIGMVVSPAGTACSTYPSIGLDITLTTNASIDSSSVNGQIQISPTYPATATLAIGSNTLTLTKGTMITHAITGSGAISVSGISGLDAANELAGNNSSYTGNISVASGAILSIYNQNGLGTSAGTTTIQDGARLQMCTNGSGNIVISEPITIGGKGLSSTSFNGAFVINSCMGSSNGDSVEFTGTVTLTANTEVNLSRNLKISGPLGGAFTLTSQTGSTGVLTIASSNNTSSSPNAVIDPVYITTTYSDETTGALSVLVGNIGIVTGKRGDVTVQGILKGTGTVGNIQVFASGILAPGMSPGCINSGNLDLSAGTYQVELEDLTACTEYDQTKVTGTVTLGGTLQIVRFNNMVPRIGNAFRIIDNDGTDAVTGTFAGLAQGATTTVDGITYTISYTGGDGNDVVLTVTGVNASLGAPNTGALQLLKAGVVLPLLAMVSGVGILAVQVVTSRKK